MPTITLDPTSGNVGDTVTITGSGFADEAIDFTFAPNGAITVIEDPVTAASGAFVATYVIPAAVEGAHAITATDQSAGTDSADFTVLPLLVITEAQAQVGDTINFTGTGFNASEVIDFEFDSSSVTVVEDPLSSDSTGGFTGTYIIPAISSGTKTLDATDQTLDTDDDTIVIIPKITISDASGTAGDTTVITGSGFAASSLMSYTFDGDAIVPAEDPITTTSVGAFAAATITIPTGHDDVVNVVATDASAGTDTITYNVLFLTGGEVATNTTYEHLSGRDNRLRSVNSVPSREKGAMVDLTFSSSDTYDTGGVTVDFSGIDNFSQVYLCKIIHNNVGLNCSYIPASGNAAASGKIKFWGTNGSELADNSTAISSKTVRVFIRGI